MAYLSVANAPINLDRVPGTQTSPQIIYERTVFARPLERVVGGGGGSGPTTGQLWPRGHPWLSAAPAPAPYVRYVDLGNVALAGMAQCAATDPTVLYGFSGGQAGGSTVVAGAMVVRGMEASSTGTSNAGADTLTVTQESSTTADVFGSQMFGS